MKRWAWVWIAAVLSCIPILSLRNSSSALLQDTDTAFLLKQIRAEGDPWRWFTHDWPLGNHFYRPISTLTFQLDNALYRNQAAGYGLTNALLCCACVILLAWAVREITDSAPIAIASTVIFALWHAEWLVRASTYFAYIALLIGFFGLFRHGFKVRYWLPAVAAFGFLCVELRGIAPLQFRMIEWLPGRTASTMTVFCLAAIAAYARFERRSAIRTEAPPTSMDEPAGTRSSSATESGGKFDVLWAVASLLFCALALGSYEQAVMLPAALVAVGVSFRYRRYQVRWIWPILSWGLLILYYIARRSFLPEGVSSYQSQQFRSGPGVYMDLATYILPCLTTLYFALQILDLGWIVLIGKQVYEAIWIAYGNVAGFLSLRRHWVLAATGYSLSCLAFLPMAWLNRFDHYHYWPMAMRSLFVTMLAIGVWDLTVTALSPPARQAPPRPAAAPGSLPHP